MLLLLLIALLSTLTFAQKSGTIDGELIKAGKSIGVQDILIAGVAIKRKDTLLTRNIKDFEKIKNLKIESY